MDHEHDRVGDQQPPHPRRQRRPPKAALVFHVVGSVSGRLRLHCRAASRDHNVPARIIDGKALAAKIQEQLVAARAQLGPAAVRLVSLRVGDHQAAGVYLRNQMRAAERVGIELIDDRLPGAIDEAGLVRRVEDHNRDPKVTGILVQRPLPQTIDPRTIQAAIAPHKDVEGMNPANMGAILYREPLLAPCTALAALHVIMHALPDVRGAEAVVVGHSEIVGKPIAILLLHHLATVTVCHIGTRNLAEHTRGADILVVAVGKAGLVTGDMIRPGALVVDIGINQRTDGGVCGDVDFASAVEVAGQITPVPGGVGPVTVQILMRNTLRAAGAHEI
ncbi:MAG: bifunctional 5,10-methylenetetrahydrofolate dehydrogenase/5,10-methenyltetrahydrofolate cyclohydrolase [Planctomycetota bacterium]